MGQHDKRLGRSAHQPMPALRRQWFADGGVKRLALMVLEKIEAQSPVPTEDLHDLMRSAGTECLPGQKLKSPSALLGAAVRALRKKNGLLVQEHGSLLATRRPDDLSRWHWRIVRTSSEAMIAMAARGKTALGHLQEGVRQIEMMQAYDLLPEHQESARDYAKVFRVCLQGVKAAEKLLAGRAPGLVRATEVVRKSPTPEELAIVSNGQNVEKVREEQAAEEFWLTMLGSREQRG